MTKQNDLGHPYRQLQEALGQFAVEAVKASQAFVDLVAAADWSAMFPDLPEPELIVVDSSLWTGRAS